MGDRILAIALLAVHFGILAFLVFGGLLAVRWPRVVWAHVALVGWGVVSSVWQMPCPITGAENWARGRAGMALYEDGFIETYIQGVLYPDHHVNWARGIALLVIVYSWMAAYRAAVRRRQAVQVSFALPPVPVPVRQSR